MDYWLSDITILHAHIFFIMNSTYNAPMASAFNNGEIKMNFLSWKCFGGNKIKYQCQPHEFIGKVGIGDWSEKSQLLAHIIHFPISKQRKDFVFGIGDIYNMPHVYLWNDQENWITGGVGRWSYRNKDTERPFGKTVYELFMTSKD